MLDTARSVIVYDGACAFCRRQVARIRDCERGSSFEYLPRQTPGIEKRFPRLAEGDFNSGMRLISPGGQIFVGADAVYEVVRALPGWRRFAWLYRLPAVHALARRAYTWIAAHRQSLSKLSEPCADDACKSDS